MRESIRILTETEKTTIASAVHGQGCETMSDGMTLCCARYFPMGLVKRFGGKVNASPGEQRGREAAQYLGTLRP